MKYFFTLLLVIFTFTQAISQEAFNQLNDSENWKLKFSDKMSKKWKSKWFLDGLRADLRNTKNGLVYSAGDVEGDDSCHAVLWTNTSFEGTVKIEFDYTRTDTRTEWVNILYIFATGVGEGQFAKDIKEWSSYRTIPSMRYYFDNTKALQLSYAAYKRNNTDPADDYIRMRKYPRLPHQSFGKDTEIPSAYFKTNLFKPGVTYHFTVIKAKDTVYFKVEGDGKSKLMHWKSPLIAAVTEGRIGLRHMHTRSARYANFKIFQVD